MNPIKWYIHKVKNSIEPTNPTHRINMSIEINKGQTEGRALIPCSIYSMDHEIDTNPSLLRKKDKKIIKNILTNENIKYDPEKFDVVLTKEEKEEGYVLNEVDRCPHCGLKTVIAEVAETRYRSCPDIKVRISDPAKENLVIPVKFGVRKGQILFTMFTPFVFDIFLIWILLTFKYPSLNILGESINKLVQFNIIIGIVMIVPVALFVFHIGVLCHYKAYKLSKWYKSVKQTLEKVEK